MTATMPIWLKKLDDPDVQLGGHINALRGLRVCSQSELGDAIGVTQTTMSKKLRGEVGITFAELLKLAKFFELSVEDLIPPKYAGERIIGAALPRLDSNQQPSG